MEDPEVKRLKSPEEETPASRSSSPKQCWRRRRFGSSEPKILTTDQKRDTVEIMCEATGLCRYAVQRPVADAYFSVCITELTPERQRFGDSRVCVVKGHQIKCQTCVDYFKKEC